RAHRGHGPTPLAHLQQNGLSAPLQLPTFPHTRFPAIPTSPEDRKSKWRPGRRLPNTRVSPPQTFAKFHRLRRRPPDPNASAELPAPRVRGRPHNRTAHRTGTNSLVQPDTVLIISASSHCRWRSPRSARLDLSLELKALRAATEQTPTPPFRNPRPARPCPAHPSEKVSPHTPVVWARTPQTAASAFRATLGPQFPYAGRIQSRTHPR
ncbi:MAG: hypothetical protein ACI9X4_003022, partial [Glaciecola sp.]